MLKIFSNHICIQMLSLRKLNQFINFFYQCLDSVGERVMGKYVGNAITVFGLANGMIGGTILVLPILGLAAGYIISPILIIVMGSISLYTAYLIIIHLGKQKNIKESILAHFHQNYRYMVAYGVIIWMSQIPLLILYFKLISLQLQGILNCCEIYIGPCVLVFLVIQILIVRIYQIGEETMAFGIISIIMYIAFLFWAQFSAPNGQKQVPQFGSPYNLASALLMAFSVHDFIVQNIIRNPNRLEYVKIVVQTFIIGIVTYMFITFGSYGMNFLMQLSSTERLSRLFSKQRLVSNYYLNALFDSSNHSISNISVYIKISNLSNFQNKIKFFFKLERRFLFNCNNYGMLLVLNFWYVNINFDIDKWINYQLFYSLSNSNIYSYKMCVFQQKQWIY